MEAQTTLSQVKLQVVWEVSNVPAMLDLVRGGYGYAALRAPPGAKPSLARRTSEVLRELSQRICATESAAHVD